MKIEEKRVIRERILKLIRNQKEEDKLQKSLVILEKLFAWDSFKKAATVLFYASFDGEVETYKMMAQAMEMKKKVALPITLMREEKIIPISIDNFDQDLEAGPYGIKQPRYDQKLIVDNKDIDVVIVPGVAYDKQNYRLGRGKGFYDRFLKELPDNTTSAGLAFDCQVVDSLPHEEHDIPVDCVISN